MAERAMEVGFGGASHTTLLRNHAQALRGVHLRDMFAIGPGRARSLSVSTEHVFYDYSRQRVTDETMQLLLGLAQERGLRDNIEDMFTGRKINVTEGRAVLHTALRDPLTDVFVDGQDVRRDVRAVLTKVRNFSEDIHSGRRKGITGRDIKHIVVIGIGGSYLGPQYLAEACRAYAKKGMTLDFIANVDGADFVNKTGGLKPEETLFVVVSKTFTTAETMKNAETARRWMLQKFKEAQYEQVLGHFDSEEDTNREIIRRHFVAVSTAKDKVEAFGIDPRNMFGFWDWVGGRYSATSAVGAVPLSLFLGYDRFEQILQGAKWMDDHFRRTPFARNIPVLSGLIDIWNINFLGFPIRALLPYCQDLSRLPAHTQQNEMESNGKLVDIFGRPVDFETGEVVFGEPGTNGQHSLYQLLHQGRVIPADFIGFVKPQYGVGISSSTELNHHDKLMANLFAQPDALAFGLDDPVHPHKNFPGNRPSSVLLLRMLTPFEAGLLLAWTEHRTAVKGFIWGINSFDQFGVELGKELCVDIEQRFTEYRGHSRRTLNIAKLNTSTARMLEAFVEGGLPV